MDFFLVRHLSCIYGLGCMPEVIASEEACASDSTLTQSSHQALQTPSEFHILCQLRWRHARQLQL